MIFIALFFFELTLLFIMARSLQRRLSSFLFSIFHRETHTIKLMAIIFFPGTVLHEFAHAGMARLLMVPVGSISLTPKIEGTSVRLGSVAIAKTDIIRRLLIGVAPFIAGNGIILGLLYVAQKYTLWTNSLFVGISLFILFQVCNTMFSSKRDLQGAFSFLLLLSMLSSIFYFVGFRVSTKQLIGLIPETVFSAFQIGSYYLFIPLGIDIAVIIFIAVLQKIFSIER